MQLENPIENRWSARQFALFRIALGAYLFFHFVTLLPWGSEMFSSSGVLPSARLSPLARLFPNIFLVFDSPLAVWICLLAGAISSLFLFFGKFDRIAAVLTWYLWACLYGRNPLIGNPSLPFIGWILLAYAFVPATRNRGGFCPANSEYTAWRFPSDLFLASWILLSLTYLYGGCTKLISPSWIDGTALSHVLASPLSRPGILRTLLLAVPPVFLRLASWSALAIELSFAPLALLDRCRPYIWLATVAMHVALMFLVNFADLTIAMLIVHFFTFDPGWIVHPCSSSELIFFDGDCGLCHGFVRFVLAENHSAQPFRFAPLQGETIRKTISDETRACLPDSIAVFTADNEVLIRSRAVLFALIRMGGLWTITARLLQLIPAQLGDLAYNRIAAVRKSLSWPNKKLCPLAPAAWKGRLLN